MPVETVRIAFLRDTVVPAPIDGVLVRVFDASRNLVTTTTSGVLETGVADFEVEASVEGTEYTVRFYLAGASIAPKRIVVYSPASSAPLQTNDFEVDVTLFALEPSPDPLMCRCSGYVIGPMGRPRAGVDLSFTPKFHAFVDSARTALTGNFIVRTDRNGFLKVDLYRYGMYEVVVTGQEPVARDIEVPNRSAILVGHLLFPVVVMVGYDQPAPFTVARNQTLMLTPAVRSTDYRNLGVAAEDVLYSIADPSIASVQILGDRIAIRGLRAGTTSLRVTRLDRSIVYLPDLGITGGDAAVVVT